jgi:hypothetical protein
MRRLSPIASLLASIVALFCVGARAQPSPPVHHRVAMADGAIPTSAGQAAFGAIQEVVGLLRADPKTDWSKVDIDALRQHLIDMDEVTMRAAVRKAPIDGGLRLEITGDGRTLDAIRRMVPDHARAIDRMNGWSVRSEPLPNGALLMVTASAIGDAVKIRALGFAGLLVLGDHHRPHHLAMARGEMVHTHR